MENLVRQTNGNGSNQNGREKKTYEIGTSTCVSKIGCDLHSNLTNSINVSFPNRTENTKNQLRKIKRDSQRVSAGGKIYQCFCVADDVVHRRLYFRNNKKKGFLLLRCRNDANKWIERG